MKIRYFSPSYKRAGRTKIDKYLPFVRFVVSESEAEAYKQHATDPASIVVMPDHVQGNIARVRNWILDQNRDADLIVMLDDDLHQLNRFNKNQRHTLSADQVRELCEQINVLMQDGEIFLAGVNMNDSKGSYREYTPFSFTSCVLGPFTCIRPLTTLRYDESIPLKEDYDYSIQHLNRYRKVLRLNFIHYRCDHLTNPGGCAVYRTGDTEREQFKLLQQKWGSDIVKHDDHSKQLFDYNPIIRVPIKGV